MPIDDNFEQHFARELAEGDKRMNSLTDEVAAIKLEQAQFRLMLKENTDATVGIKADTAELLEVFQSFKGAMKVLEWIGKAAKPLGWVIAMCAAFAAFWTSLKSGVHTK
jgi:ABC-type phosphate transport system auxiliary subunit